MSIKRQAGITLVEIIIAVALSAVIITGIVQVFLSNRQAFNLSESMARVQENGRFAINIISEAIRTSGNYGCIPWYSSEIGNIQRQVTSEELNGFDAVTISSKEGGTSADPDVLEILRLVGEPAPINSIVYASSTTSDTVITTEWALSDVAKNDLLLVSNCLVGDFVKAGAVDEASKAITVDGSSMLRTGLYDREDQQNTVSKVERVRFEIVDGNLNLVTNDGLNGGGSTPDINGSSNALIGGIENIQFRYGVDTDDDYVPNYIDDYDEILSTDKDDIIAIEVNVLVSSIDSSVQNIVSEPQTITFAGKDYTATDRKLYRAFQTLVTIRNRVK